MGGIVVCVHQRPAEEGAKVLEAGGDAFDAAVTTAFCQMAILPFSCGVGGGMTAILYSALNRERVAIDGNMRAGSRVTPVMWAKDYLGESDYIGESLFADYRSTMGYTSICTPGSVAALADMHRRFGTMPWPELLQPAARLARDGYALTDDFLR
ncbi:MAG: hypothetical protein FJ319_00240 [SAR202 cluster bacterium]|nr:hypothetical protein [SAR202 cluster bacterium]